MYCYCTFFSALIFKQYIQKTLKIKLSLQSTNSEANTDTPVLDFKGVVEYQSKGWNIVVKQILMKKQNLKSKTAEYRSQRLQV